MKIRSVRHNNRKKAFEVRTSMKNLIFPFSKADPAPTIEDPITELFVDPEAGREAFTYVLQYTALPTHRSLRIARTFLSKTNKWYGSVEAATKPYRS